MSDFEPFEFLPGDRAKGLLLLCDHARNVLPEQYGSLGLPERELQRHIAWDIGAEAITRRLSSLLGVPALVSGYSRLLIDMNRGEDDPTLIRQIYDGTVIPGNYPIGPAEIEYRLAHFHRPYHAAIAAELSAFRDAGIVPAVFSVHSMTDFWEGWKRPWQVSILWDSDPRFAVPMLEWLRNVPGLTVGDNQPYDGALENDTLFRHCTSRGYANVLIEFRQDLVITGEQAHEWADLVAPMIDAIIARPGLHEIRHYGSRSVARMNDMAGRLQD